MELYGADVVASPSNKTAIGRQILKKDPKSIGSLGIAISEAIDDALHHKNTKYSLGSVLNFVLLHQTIIGLEAKKQLEKVHDYPDIVIGCCGGGSNLAGISYPFLADKLEGKKPNLRTIAVESNVCPSLCKGEYRYDYGDEAGLTPLLKMKTMGNKFMPAAIHATVKEAKKCQKEGKRKTILFNLSGHGFLDLQAYADLFEHKLNGDSMPLIF